MSVSKISSIDHFVHAWFSSSVNIRIKISFRYRYNLIDLIDPQSITHILPLVDIIDIIIDLKIYIIDRIEQKFYNRDSNFLYFNTVVS